MRAKDRKTPRKAALVAVAALILSLVAACGGGSSGAATSKSGGLTDIKFALQPNADLGAVWVGDEAGIFKKHGFKLTFPPVATSGSSATAQLLNGQIQVAAGSIGSVISAVAQGVPVRAVASYSIDYDKDGKTLHSLIVADNSGITAAKDLEGKTVGVNSLKSNWEVELRETVAKDGGDPSKVKIVAIPFADQVAALKQKRVDGIIAVQPFATQIIGHGFVSLGDPMTIALDNQKGSSGYMFAANSFLKKNPGFVKNWQAAVAESSAYANAHPDIAKKTIAEKTGVPISVFEKAPLPLFDGTLDPQMIGAWSALLAKYGIVDKAPPVADLVATS